MNILKAFKDFCTGNKTTAEEVFNDCLAVLQKKTGFEYIHYGINDTHPFLIFCSDSSVAKARVEVHFEVLEDRKGYEIIYFNLTDKVKHSHIAVGNRYKTKNELCEALAPIGEAFNKVVEAAREERIKKMTEAQVRTFPKMAPNASKTAPVASKPGNKGKTPQNNPNATQPKPQAPSIRKV